MIHCPNKKLLALIWGHRLFRDEQISAPEGEICVESPGYVSEMVGSGVGCEGPDFLNAAVRYGDTVIYGGVRVDGRASEWRETGRMTDPVFDSVAFHVVGERDRVLVRDGHPVRTLVLTPAPELELLHVQMLDQATVGANGCIGFFGAIEPVEQEQIIARLLSDRLRRKTAEVERLYHEMGGDWEQTAYVCYLRSLGMGVRKQSYEALARSIPLRCFVRCAGDRLQAEALLLGQSGYLAEVGEADPAIRQLQDIYLTLKQEYGLRRPVVSWSSAGVRPASLPPTVLRQAASLLARAPILASEIRKAIDGGMVVLRDLFGETAIGVSSEKIDLRIINLVIPLLTAIGMETGDAELRDRALALYEEVAPEVNRYTRHWGEVFDLRSAADSQAVIQLCTEYCDRARCAECPVGVLRLVKLWKKMVNHS